MDPQKAFDELMSIVGGSVTVVGDDYDRVQELARGLWEWLSKGGFLPTVESVRGTRVEVSRRWVVELLQEYIKA